VGRRIEPGIDRFCDRIVEASIERDIFADRAPNAEVEAVRTIADQIAALSFMGKEVLLGHVPRMKTGDRGNRVVPGEGIEAKRETLFI